MERLQKIIANSGVCSRRKAEELITAGKVIVNGEVITELGFKAEYNDSIVVNGNLLKKEDKVYYLLNKPKGVVTTVKDEHNRKTVIDLIPTDKRIYPVGRLDYDTTGLLILTNDGDLSNLLMHPSNEIDKVYVAKLEGVIKGESINQLKNGVEIDGVKVKASRVKLKKTDYPTNSCIVEITIHEGKNHQVKKMFEAVNYNVLKLKRERVGFLGLDNLKSGEFRTLNPKEVGRLYNLSQNKRD